MRNYCDSQHGYGNRYQRVRHVKLVISKIGRIIISLILLCLSLQFFFLLPLFSSYFLISFNSWQIITYLFCS
jgi:hypothetical protein